MFNLKKFKIAIDLSKKVNPEDIPGATIEQKAAYIAEYLDKEIGEKLLSKEIDIDTAYKLLAETRVTGVSESFDFLEKYRFNISQLLQQASFIKSELSETGLNKDEVAQLIVQKLLERVNQVYIPELIELNRTSKRSSDEAVALLSKLPDYTDENQINSIKMWISREMEREVNEIVSEYINIRDRALQIPNFDTSDLVIMLTHTPVESLKIIFPDRRKTGGTPLPSKFNDPTVVKQVESINDEIQKLARKITIRGDMGWTKILALSDKLPEQELERWKKLIEHPMKFNLYDILKNAGLVNAGMNTEGVEKPETIKKTGFRDKELRGRYYSIFFPALDPSTGRPFLSESEMRYMDENFNGADPSQLDFDINLRLNAIKRSQMTLKRQYARERLYEFIQEGYDGPKLQNLVLGNNLQLDQAGLAIRFYFTSICKGSREKFLEVLKSIGLDEHFDKLSEIGLDVDTSYEAARLTVNSDQEAKIITILRDVFGIDAIPFPVLIPVPTDCPTNTDNFDIDFMIFVDVLEYIDPQTFMPKITSKVMFVGEYFGFNSDKEKEIVFRGKPIVTPDGEPYTPAPKINVNTGEIIKEYSPLLPGNKVREGHWYELKTLWKKRTYETLSHIVGTDSLYFDKQDIRAPYNSVANKLDEKNIIYSFPGCSDSNNLCKAKKLIANSLDFELKENLDNPEYHKINVYSEKNKCIRLIDSAILNFKFQNVLKRVKKEFIGRQGYDRQTIKFHNDYYDGLRFNIENGTRILTSPNATVEQKLAAQQMIEQNHAEMQTLENSPLYRFKQRYEELLQDTEIAKKLNQLNEIRKLIVDDKIETTIQNVKALILEVDEGIFGFVPDPEAS